MPTDLNDLDALIQQSSMEDLDDQLPDFPGQPAAARLNHPMEVLLAWLLCLAIAGYYFLGSADSQQDLGIRSVDNRLSVALYHVAYRVEVYRNVNGQLPDFIEDHWAYSDMIDYTQDTSGYILTGELGEHQMVYREGEDPERLIRHAMYRPNPE